MTDSGRNVQIYQAVSTIRQMFVWGDTMARAKKDGRSVNFYIDRNIMDRVEDYAEENGQTLTKAVERLLEKALEDEKKDQADRVAAGIE